MKGDSPYAFAIFEPASSPLELERIDTRLYFQVSQHHQPDKGLCLGSFWLQNPGSARYERPDQQLGTLGPLKVDPLMRHLRAVLDVVLLHTVVPADAYAEILNIHYFSDLRGGLRGGQILNEIPDCELCKRGIATSSKFLVLGLGKGWGASFARRVAVKVAERLSPLVIIAPDGQQSDADALRVNSVLWLPEQGVPTLPPSIFPNPIGATTAWKQAYVGQVGLAISLAISR